MAEQQEKPRPHGDPLRDETVEPNSAQRQSDAPPGERARGGGPARMPGGGSTASGIPAADEEHGQERRRQYSEGAEVVSRID